MQTFQYRKLLESVEGFDKWLLSLGLTPRSDDRIHRAFAVLRMADEAIRKGRETGEYASIKPEHLFPLVEALEAHDIFNAFEKDSSKALSDSLKRALSGPYQPVDEKSEASRDARNVWFELALAAEWKLLGATVHLAEPDLQLIRDGATFLVACKRPANEHSVRANIRSAISQLRDNLSSASDGVFGVIAISLSRVLNPGTKLWRGDIEQLGHHVYSKMIQYDAHWQSASVDPRICAILFHAATPSTFGEKVDVTRASYTVARPLKQISSGTKIFEEYMREIKKRLS